MAVTAGMVKELREMTGAGMMDCKKALAATDGDMDKAVEFLREKGLAGAAKKAYPFPPDNGSRFLFHFSLLLKYFLCCHKYSLFHLHCQEIFQK